MGTGNPVFNWIFFIIMRVVFLHTIPYQYEINNLILDISLNVKKTDFQFFEYPCLHNSRNLLTNLFKLKKFILANKIDVIHVYDYIDAYLVLKVTQRTNVKVVFSDYYYHDELKGCKSRIYKAVLKKVNHIILQSETHKNYLMNSFDLSPEKCTKLYHAFCFNRFDGFDFKSVRDEFFIDDLRFLVGTMGDFTPQRSMMSVFKMIKKLRRTGRNFTCVISGGQVDEYDDNYDACKYYYIMQGLDNYITYMGKRHDDANVLRQLDLFVYSSGREPIALPVIEAMLSGVNVVVNDNDMIKEITSNGKYALLYEENNETDFAIKARDVLQDLEDYKMIAEVVMNETREIFAIDKHILGLKRIYETIND